MKLNIHVALLLVTVQYCSSFLTLKDFKGRKDLVECYRDKTENRIGNEIVNGQELPLPSSIETFIALVERLESTYQSMAATEIIQKLLMSFRADELPADFRTWSSSAKYANEIERAFFNVPETLTYSWEEKDFTNDEKCALHFMLSHTVNTTSSGKSNEETREDGTLKRPIEYGVVSLHAKWKHAFALNKVLLGILAGLSGSNQFTSIEFFRKLSNKREESLANDKVNRLYAVTIGVLVSSYVNKEYKRGEVSFLPNGIWNDPSCPTQYSLTDNNEKRISMSLLRGAVDGLIIGKKLEDKIEAYQKMRLSQILRLYYGPAGLIDDLGISTRSETQWCVREKNFGTLASSNLREEILNVHKVYTNYIGSEPLETAPEEIGEVVSAFEKSSEVFGDIAAEASSECGSSELSSDKKCSTPFDIFAILDMSTQDSQRNFQIEVLGNLSLNFDVRPKGSSISVYTNLSPVLSGGLHMIVNNSGVSGCQACFSKYYVKRGSKLSEQQVFEKLSETLTEFSELEDNTQTDLSEVKSGSPAKVILFFTYATSQNDDWKLRDTVWQIEKNFREATILGIGPNKDALKTYTINDDNDIFVTPSSVANAADFANKLKSRICKAPAEFQFKECRRSSRSTEGENRQIGFISLNKKQYWAMYPKYFLKSFNVYLKFKPLEGAQVKVCFSRNYFRILEDNSQYNECFESTGDEIKFYAKDPCKRRNEHNCDPFYFSVEGKKAPNTACESIQCNTPRDIQFEFQHEGISCNSATVLFISKLSLLLCAFLFILQKH